MRCLCVVFVAAACALPGCNSDESFYRDDVKTLAAPLKTPGQNGDGRFAAPFIQPDTTTDGVSEDSSQNISLLWLLLVYSVLILLASLTGGWLPFLMQLTHTRMQMMVSLVAGLMLGIGLFHMLPHAFAELGSLDRAVWWTLVGLLTMFFLIRAFHFHHHGEVELPAAMPASRPVPAACHDHDHAHGEGHDHPHAHKGPSHHHHGPHAHGHTLNWAGVAFGLAVHTLIDGIALAASVETAAGHGTPGTLFGLGTFLAILLHKPLDAVSITSLMVAGGWPARWRHLVNLGFALMCPVGVLLFYLGIQQFTDNQHVIVGCALAFAAGVFLCISLGDLLPEVEFHSHDRLKLSAALLIGIALAYGIGYLEPDHAHGHGPHGQIQPPPAPSTVR